MNGTVNAMSRNAIMIASPTTPIRLALNRVQFWRKSFFQLSYLSRKRRRESISEPHAGV